MCVYVWYIDGAVRRVEVNTRKFVDFSFGEERKIVSKIIIVHLCGHNVGGPTEHRYKLLTGKCFHGVLKVSLRGHEFSLLECRKAI